MDEAFLIRLQSTLQQIRLDLLNNAEIRKLVFYSSDSMTNKSISDLTDVSMVEASNFIVLQPVYDGGTEPPFNSGTCITISTSNGSVSEDGIIADYVVRVSVICDKKNWTFNSGKIRPIILAQDIINILHNKKYDCSNQIHFVRYMEQIVTKTQFGYALLFSVSDGVASETT